MSFEAQYNLSTCECLFYILDYQQSIFVQCRIDELLKLLSLMTERHRTKLQDSKRQSKIGIASIYICINTYINYSKIHFICYYKLPRFTIFYSLPFSKKDMNAKGKGILNQTILLLYLSFILFEENCIFLQSTSLLKRYRVIHKKFFALNICNLFIC